MLQHRSLAATAAGFLIVSCVTGAWAADLWASKSYTEWSDRDIQKILTDSPWARAVSITLDSPRRMAPPVAGGVGERSVGIGLGQASGRPPADGGVAPPETHLIVRWQSSIIIQQALVKAQYGVNAATSPEAQKRLDPNKEYYVIAVANLPPSFEPDGPDAKAALLALTRLAAKDKEPIVAQDVLFVQKGETAEARFLFQRNAGFTAEDKQVGFATRFGKISVKARFILKDMSVRGKLEL